MHNILIIDSESSWDDTLYRAYRSVDPKAARRRLASRRIFAAAALDLSLSDAGVVTVNGLASWTEHEHGDDTAIAAALFDHIRFRPDHQVVTFAGLAAEVPLMALTAMQAGLVLPPQLRAVQRHPFGRPRPHRDLALEMKAQGRDWAHLSEILLRLGLPPTLIAGKTKVDLPSTRDGWARVRTHVELDTVLTAIALIAWMGSQGTPGIRIEETITHLASWFLREREPALQQKLALEEVCAEMAARIGHQAPKAA